MKLLVPGSKRCYDFKYNCLSSVERKAQSGLCLDLVKAHESLI